MSWIRKNLAITAALCQLLAFFAVVVYGASDKLGTIRELQKSQIEVKDNVKEFAKKSEETAKDVNSLKKDQEDIKDTVDKIERNQADGMKEVQAVQREQAAMKAIQSRIEKDLDEMHKDIKELLKKLK